MYARVHVQLIEPLGVGIQRCRSCKLWNELLQVCLQPYLSNRTQPFKTYSFAALQ